LDLATFESRVSQGRLRIAHRFVRNEAHVAHSATLLQRAIVDKAEELRLESVSQELTEAGLIGAIGQACDAQHVFSFVGSAVTSRAVQACIFVCALATVEFIRVEIEVPAVPISDLLESFFELIEATKLEQVDGRLGEEPDGRAGENLENEPNSHEVEPVSAHEHEVKRREQVDAPFEAVPESANEVLFIGGHELHHEQKVDIGADRVEEAPEEDDGGQEVHVRGEHHPQVEAQAEQVVVGDQPLAPINIAHTWHPKQSHAPPKEKHR